MPVHPVARDILAFWFGPTPRVERPEWFRKDDAFDATIRARFGPAVEAAIDGAYAEWTATPLHFAPDAARDEDLAKHAAKHRTELLDPTLSKEWERSPEFWVAGGSFESSRCDFSVVRGESRTRRSPTIGFRCAASLKDVQRGLERGRYRDAAR